MTYHIAIEADGRTVVLPEEVIRDLGLRPGASIAAELDGKTLHMKAAQPSGALERLRAALQGYSLDEFIAERRRDSSS